jgi:hypothetical protein
LKAKIDELLSPEAQEELAEDLLAQAEAEGDVMEEELEEDHLGQYDPKG